MFKNKFFWLVIFFIFVGLALRIYTLTASEFFRDEAFSTLVAQKGFPEIIETITTDSSVPFSYFVMHVIGELFGYTTITMRLPAFISGVIAFIFFWKLLKLLNLKNGTKYFLLIMFCINPPLIYYSTEARFYGIFIAVFTYQLYLLTQIWKSQKITTTHQILFILTSLIGVYNHILYWFVLLIWGIGAILFIKQNYKVSGKRVFIKTLLPFVITALLFVPWIPILLGQLRGGGNGTWLEFNLYNTLVETVNNMAISPAWFNPKQIDNITVFPAILGTVTTILMLLGALKTLTVKAYSPYIKFTLVFCASILGFYLISFKTPVFYIRYLSFLIPVFLILIGISVDSFGKKASAVVMIILVVLTAWIHIYIILPRADSNITVTKLIVELDRQAEPDTAFLVLNKDALTYFNMEFYAHDKYTSYIYDPNLSTPIWVGKVVIPDGRFIQGITSNFTQIFVVTDSGLGQNILSDLDSHGYTESHKFDYSHNLQLFVFEK